MNYSSNPIWNNKFSFKYELTCKELLEEKLKISIHTNKNKLLNKIEIYLFEICTGPIHFDYKITKHARIYFDLIMAQVVNLEF